MLVVAALVRGMKAVIPFVAAISVGDDPAEDAALRLTRNRRRVIASKKGCDRYTSRSRCCSLRR